jgi:tetratricopeptide (TPR) repeat protein
MCPDRPLVALYCALVSTAIGAQNPPEEIQAKIVPLFQSARQAEQRRDFAEAAKFYDAILVLDPKLAEIWTNKGLALYELDRHREALDAFAHAASLKPALITPQLFLGIEFLRLGEARKSVAPLEAVVAREPGHKQALYELAEADMRLERFEPAVKLCRELIKREPGMEQAWYRLGIVYMNWSQTEARKLIGTHPRSGWGDLLLAEFEAVAGFTEDAEANYRAAVDALPAAVQPRLALGRLYLDSNPGAAGEQFEKAGELAPEHQRATVAKIRRALAEGDLALAKTLAGAAWDVGLPAHTPDALAELNRQSQQEPRALYWFSLTLRALARETFEEAIRRNPNSYRTHLLLAELANDPLDPGKARAEYAKAAQLAPEDPEVQLSYIQFLEGAREDGAALAAAQQAATTFPRHPALNIELGKILLHSGQAQEAAACFEQALRTDPNLASAYAGLADSYAAMGELEKAAQEMQRALAGDADGSLHYRLGRWYQRLGKEREASDAFRETALRKEERRKNELMQFTLMRE